MEPEAEVPAETLGFIASPGVEWKCEGCQLRAPRTPTPSARLVPLLLEAVDGFLSQRDPSG